MHLSDVRGGDLGAILRGLFGAGPPPLPQPGPTSSGTGAIDVAPPPTAKAYTGGDFLLSDLPVDLLRELYTRIALPCALKRVCWALHRAGPKETESKLSDIVKSSWRFRWAYRLGCPFVWNADLAARMARHGAQEALRWAHREGLAWDDRAGVNAGKHGHLETLKVLAFCGAPIAVKEIVKRAATHGQIHVLDWLVDEDYSLRMDEWACLGAARHGQLAALQWLRARHCPWNAWCIVYAAMGGHLHVIEWARANGCAWNRQATMWAARQGHLEVLQWLRQHGCNWDAKACMWAARNGHFEVLQWLRAGGEGGLCPWNSETSWAAAANGHLHVLQWAIERGCPAIWTTWAGAALAGHIPVLRWLHSQGWKRHGVNKDDAVGVCGRGAVHPDVLRWLKTMDRWDRVRAHVASRRSRVTL